ncbi:ABC transporter substrate-binding protein [Mesorhizobium microcysteis]|uniref:ABC transporter substrate-binding protein n=1 Tax=Neoaquamicrobium microcysteis TaxID=2682781 RepID=A0A5D4GXV5_9HYPH|nr:ABC transporter substrate-binding protein [Mesorhizobium microcysteis]TYR33426.1 ABC transporter substrate-binding protein [Mesorhizobium microcysteis]
MKPSICTLAFASALLAGAGTAMAQTRGVTDTEILLGSSVDLTGPVASIGVPMKAGFEIAAEMINEAGGIHGRKVRVLVEDNGYDTRRAILAVQKLINSDEAFGIIGLLGSAITQVALPITTEQGVPMLFPAAPTHVVYDPPQELSFGLVTGYDLQMEAATSYAHDELGLRKFCMMYQDDESGEQSLAGVERKLGELGLSLVEKTSYKRGATDYSAQFARMKAADCDAVMLGTIVRETAGAALEREKIGWDVPLFAPQGAVSNAVIALGGAAVEGLYAFTPSLPISLVLDDEKIAAAVERYKQQSGQDRNPDDYFLVSLAGMLLFAEGARNAGPDLTVESFVAGMEQVKDFDVGKGWGRMTFTAERRLGSTKNFAMQVKDGAWAMIKEID